MCSFGLFTCKEMLKRTFPKKISTLVRLGEQKKSKANTLKARKIVLSLRHLYCKDKIASKDFVLCGEGILAHALLRSAFGRYTTHVGIDPFASFRIIAKELVHKTRYARQCGKIGGARIRVRFIRDDCNQNHKCVC